MAVVEGNIQTRSWDNAEGKKNYATEVVVSQIYFGESKREAEAPVDSSPVFAPIGTDEDLPF